LLNAGYRRGAVVGRCVMQGSTAVTEELPSFAPVALAGLGRLPDTVLSRSIVIRMQRRAPDEHVIPYRRREHAEEGQRLCSELAAWAAAAASRITVPDMPGEVVDRDADCWEPLLAMADAADGHWPDTARCCAVALVLLLREEGEERLSLRLLADSRESVRGARIGLSRWPNDRSPCAYSVAPAHTGGSAHRKNISYNRAPDGRSISQPRISRRDGR